MRTATRLVLGLLTALVVFAGTGEILARALGILDRLNGYTRMLFVRGPDRDLPYRLRPGLHTRVLGVDVRVNALGMRGPELATDLRPGVRRVLLLGDSVVFGQGVAENETVSAGLAGQLARRDGGAFEVANAGVQGYDTVAEARLLEAVGAAVRPEIVVVGASLNDYDPAPAYDPTGVLARRGAGDDEPGWLARSEFLLLLRWLRAYARGELMPQLMARAEQEGAAGVPADMAALDRWVANEHLRFYRDPTPALWQRLRDAVGRLVRRCREGDIHLLVAIFPESYQVGVEAPDLTPQRRWLALCAEVGVRCLDLQPAFAAAGGALFTDVQHPNARGHAVAAAAIAEALVP